jgi:TatD DNase family protein
VVQTDCPWCDVRPTHAGAKFLVSPLPDAAKKPEKFVAGNMVKGRNEPAMLQHVLEASVGSPL